MHILIVDDEPSAASALAAVIADVTRDESPRPQLSVVGTFFEGVGRAVAGEFDSRPKRIFLDLTLPDVGDVHPIEQMKVAASMNAHLFVWSGAIFNEEILRAAWAAGASGWIPKGISLEQLTDAVQCALKLGFYMPEDPCASGPMVAVRDAPVLSTSEVQMARLVALDLDLQAIADTLTGGSLGSARIQVAELCAKLGVLTLPEAAQRARMMGLA